VNPNPASISLPSPSQRIAVAMRDGVSLDTYVWHGNGVGSQPAILVRTPYSRAVTRVNEAPLLRYLDAGYTVVIQQIRGVGASGGRFAFCAPHERTDGYDTVEWIAAQPWCTGAVGMDGHSYAGMMQLYAAAARPPHLRCMVPAVVSVDPFAEPPYIGGVFSRLHTLVWARALQFDEHLDEGGGAFSFGSFLADPRIYSRWTSRPLRDAAEGELQGSFLQHYLDVLEHPTLDAWWQERILQPADYAAMDLPTLVVSGIFDPSVGTLKLWRALEAHASGASQRRLIIGPWDHNGSYNGGVTHRAIHGLDDAHDMDIVGARVAFFDRHLKGSDAAAAEPARVRLFVCGANHWLDVGALPVSEAGDRSLYLHSDGHANSASGDGRLSDMPAAGVEPPDRFQDDPRWPFYGAIAGVRGLEHVLDLHERVRCHDSLVYATPALDVALTVIGESALELYVSADVPDADITAWLAERRADGRHVMLAFGQLRLRYRDGFDLESELQPGEVARVEIPLTYISHRFAPGSALCIVVSGSNFPLLDPNPHQSGPIALAETMSVAIQAVHHDAAHASRLRLPVIT
jgi:uncharacterized protein